MESSHFLSNSSASSSEETHRGEAEKQGLEQGPLPPKNECPPREAWLTPPNPAFLEDGDSPSTPARKVIKAFMPGVSDQLFFTIFQNFSVGIALCDLEGYVLTSNQAYSDFLGYSPEAMVGKHFTEWTHPEDLALDSKLFQALVAGERDSYAIDKRYLRQDQTLVWGRLTISLIRHEDGSIRYVLATCEDISDRKLAEAALLASERRFRVIFENARVGIAICTPPAYQISLSNPFFQELVGYSAAELKNLDFTQFTHPEDLAREQHLIQDCLAGWRDSYDIEKRYIRKDGSVCWVSLVASIIRDTSGEIQSGIAVVIDITARKQTEVLLQRQIERETLITGITNQLRRSLNLDTILNTTVTELRRVLQVDRVLLYQLNARGQGVVIAESVGSDWQSLLTVDLNDRCFSDACIASYTRGRIQNTPDIQTANLPECYLRMLAQYQVRANLVLPILQGEQVWGLLIVQQCAMPRTWQNEEVDLLRQLADQLAVAIQQAELYQQVQHLNTSLELQVQERTTQLQQSLEFAALLKRITDKVRDSLDEQQILQTVVQELALGLDIECCDTGIYNEDRTCSTIVCEHTKSIPSALGAALNLKETLHSEVYHYLLTGKSCQFCDLVPNVLRGNQYKFTILAYPIFFRVDKASSRGIEAILPNHQDVLGDLWLFKRPDQMFSEQEIRLVQQVANQCAIAVRQARLYQAAQFQVQELERLNQLKDDFLSTVSHELRSPMANIKMALQMLEIMLPEPAIEPANNDNIVLTAKTYLKISQYLQILNQECQRETSLINDLLDLTRLDAGTAPLLQTEIDLQNWVPHIADPFMVRLQRHRQQLLLEIPSHLPPLTTDSASLERILSELLHNACKYTPDGETITIAAALVTRPSQTGPATYFEVSVSNSGVEIPANECDRIFDRFYRIPLSDPWKYGGTGLGLALVKRLVEYLGGSIRLTTGNQQTCFTIQLPFNPLFSEADSP